MTYRPNSGSGIEKEAADDLLIRGSSTGLFVVRSPSKNKRAEGALKNRNPFVFGFQRYGLVMTWTVISKIDH
jgi:hypothetical protein